MKKIVLRLKVKYLEKCNKNCLLINIFAQYDMRAIRFCSRFSEPFVFFINNELRTQQWSKRLHTDTHEDFDVDVKKLRLRWYQKRQSLCELQRNELFTVYYKEEKRINCHFLCHSGSFHVHFPCIFHSVLTLLRKKSVWKQRSQWLPNAGSTKKLWNFCMCNV